MATTDDVVNDAHLKRPRRNGEILISDAGNTFLSDSPLNKLVSHATTTMSHDNEPCMQFNDDQRGDEVAAKNRKRTCMRFNRDPQLSFRDTESASRNLFDVYHTSGQMSRRFERANSKLTWT
jgi:hypothetical protein